MMKKYLIALFMFCHSAFLFAFSQQALVTLLQRPNNTQGEFTQQRYLQGLIKPITSSGQFVLVKNRGLLWQTEKPFSNQLRVTSTGISQWDGHRWVVSQKLGQSEQIQLFLGLLSGDTQALAKQFDLTLQGSEKKWQLTLTPSSLLMKQIFTQIIIDGENNVKRIELQEKQGDRTLISFENQRVNQPISSFAQTALQ